LIEESTEV